MFSGILLIIFVNIEAYLIDCEARESLSYTTKKKPHNISYKFPNFNKNSHSIFLAYKNGNVTGSTHFRPIILLIFPHDLPAVSTRVQQYFTRYKRRIKIPVIAQQHVFPKSLVDKNNTKYNRLGKAHTVIHELYAKRHAQVPFWA